MQSGRRPSLARRFTVDDRGVQVPATTRTSLQAVKGWIVPVYTRTDPVTGKQLAGLRHADGMKVANGYACAECLADFGGVYMPSCPACGHERDVSRDIQPEPDFWKPDPNDPERNQ